MKKILFILFIGLLLWGCQNENIKNRLKGKNLKERNDEEIVDTKTLNIDEQPDQKVEVREGIIINNSDEKTGGEKNVEIVVDKDESDYTLDEEESSTSNEDMETLKRIKGYRIQLMAATSKQNAEKYGEKFKENWEEAREDEENEDSYYYRGDIPIYIEYYEPYWKLRIGNYKNRGQAKEALEFIEKLEYEDAWIVSTYILVKEKS